MSSIYRKGRFFSLTSSGDSNSLLSVIASVAAITIASLRRFSNGLFMLMCRICVGGKIEKGRRMSPQVYYALEGGL
jgi:hypothetical protein